MRNLPKAILFDHDGVLVASEPLHVKAWGEVMKKLGLPFDEKWIQSQAGKTAPVILKGLLEHHAIPASEGFFAELIQHKHRSYHSFIETELNAYPGVKEGLRWLKERNIAAAVVSNARPLELKRALEILDLLPFFQAILTREDVSTPKPHPALYLLAAERLGLSPQECMAVEDSPPGLTAALLAGVPSVAVLTNFAREDLLRPVTNQPELQPIWMCEDPLAFFRKLSGSESDGTLKGAQ